MFCFTEIIKVRRGKYQLTFSEITPENEKFEGEELVIKYMKLLEELIKKQPENWLWTDELYEFRNVNPNIKVLLNADETTYEPAKGMGANHPMAWYHEFDGGRVFYTALGHVDEVWEDADFLKHVYGGIWYAAKGKTLK